MFDTVAGTNLEKSFAAVQINGDVVTIVANATHDLTLMHLKSLSLHVVFMLLPLLRNQNRKMHGKILAEIAKITDQGALKPLIDPNHFTLATISEAHALLESGRGTRQGRCVNLEGKF